MSFRLKGFAFLVSLIAFRATGIAQNMPLGPQMEEQASTLTTSDPTLTNGRYYKSLTIQLQAGEGAMFYMIANAYMPFIYTLDTTLLLYKTGKTEVLNFSYVSTVWVTAKKDSTFHVVFTSENAGSTGDFMFGMRKLSAEQMTYTPSASLQYRLYYLINQWQCFFGLMPSTTGEYTGNWVTHNTWKTGNLGTIYSYTNYREKLFAGDVDAEKNYTASVAEITAILDPAMWDIHEVTQVDPTDGAISKSTFFNGKGGSDLQSGNSFAISYSQFTGYDDVVYLEFY